MLHGLHLATIREVLERHGLDPRARLVAYAPAELNDTTIVDVDPVMAISPSPSNAKMVTSLEVWGRIGDGHWLPI
jgi:hypothetical protein